jgi:hypothetical protein
MSCGTIFACNFVYLVVFFNCHSFVTYNSEVIVSDEFQSAVMFYAGILWKNLE